ncbi:MAG TPA: hypothetical protein VG498_22915 [Terriglobales bacterium]|nr:hypothetical protein [Terriglobales bacterium]
MRVVNANFDSRNSARSTDIKQVAQKSASTWFPETKSAIEWTEPEPFVDAHRAAEFLFLTPRRVLELARKGTVPAHPLGDGVRKVWRFRLSELAAAMCSHGVNYTRQSPAPKEI